MRIYGRIPGSTAWTVVQTDANGNNDLVYITNLIQVLKLNLGESPFYGNYGIPAQRSVVTQIAPNYYALQTQAQFAQFFSSLRVSVVPNTVNPTYNVQIVTHSGVAITQQVAQ